MPLTTKEKSNLPTPEELEAMMIVPAWLVNFGVLLLQILIYGLPAAAIVLPVVYSPQWFTVLWVTIAPLAYTFLFAIVAGTLSRPWHAGIIKGVFPRDVRFPIYAMRKLYGTCWTSVYYFKPLYSIILSIPLLRAITFRLFGYKGSLNITIFPDTWIRDLPLLRIEDGAYIANRATLGTNICLKDGNILVGKITLLKNSVVGHLSKVGVGFRLGENSEVGVGCQIGLHTKIGNNTTIGGMTGIGHFVRIGDSVEIGIRSFIGNKANIATDIILQSNSNIPDQAIVETSSDVLKFV